MTKVEEETIDLALYYFDECHFELGAPSTQVKGKVIETKGTATVTRVDNRPTKMVWKWIKDD